MTKTLAYHDESTLKSKNKAHKSMRERNSVVRPQEGQRAGNVAYCDLTINVRGKCFFCENQASIIVHALVTHLTAKGS